jgi:hypothetical protein
VDTNVYSIYLNILKFEHSYYRVKGVLYFYNEVVDTDYGKSIYSGTMYDKYFIVSEA